MSTFNKHKLSLLAAAVAGLGAMSGAQAATLTCGPNATPVRITTADKAQWSTDARNVPVVPDATTDTPAAIVDNYIAPGWFNPATSRNFPRAKTWQLRRRGYLLNKPGCLCMDSSGGWRLVPKTASICWSWPAWSSKSL